MPTFLNKDLVFGLGVVFVAYSVLLPSIFVVKSLVNCNAPPLSRFWMTLFALSAAPPKPKSPIAAKTPSSAPS